MHTAAWFGTVGPLQSLKKLGLSLLAEDEEKRTGIHIAASRSNASALKYLITASSSLNIQDSQGRTALHFAAQAGSTECLKMLINHGADVNAVDVDNATPLHLATAHDVINILLAKGGDPTIQMTNQDLSKNSVFSQYLRTGPDECNYVLTIFLLELKVWKLNLISSCGSKNLKKEKLIP